MEHFTTITYSDLQINDTLMIRGLQGGCSALTLNNWWDAETVTTLMQLFVIYNYVNIRAGSYSRLDLVIASVYVLLISREALIVLFFHYGFGTIIHLLLIFIYFIFFMIKDLKEPPVWSEHVPGFRKKKWSSDQLNDH